MREGIIDGKEGSFVNIGYTAENNKKETKEDRPRWCKVSEWTGGSVFGTVSNWW